VFIAPTQINAD